MERIKERRREDEANDGLVGDGWNVMRESKRELERKKEETRVKGLRWGEGGVWKKSREKRRERYIL